MSIIDVTLKQHEYSQKDGIEYRIASNSKIRLKRFV